MKKLLLTATALAALCVPASADIVRTLGGLNWTIGAGATLLDLSTAQPPGNQPQNNPCIICGANQPNQTNTAFRFRVHRLRQPGQPDQRDLLFVRHPS